MAPQRAGRFLLGFAYSGPLVAEERWKRWTEKNPGLFGTLGETARFALVETPNDSTGLVFTKGRDRVEVKKSHGLLFQDIPVLLTMSPATAEEILRLDQNDGDPFWDSMKFFVQRGHVQVWVHAPRAELDRVGLTGFMQVIDALPPGQPPHAHDTDEAGNAKSSSKPGPRG